LDVLGEFMTPSFVAWERMVDDSCQS
jgi:hypothetical protein